MPVNPPPNWQNLYNAYINNHPSSIFSSAQPQPTTLYPAGPSAPKKKRMTTRVSKPQEKNYNKHISSLWAMVKVPSEKEIGLEIECEGMDLYRTPIQWWAIHTDHSLRGYKGHPPLEYVLREPVSREDLTKALRYLNNKLTLSKSFVREDSPRTSVHVHINCQHLRMRQVMTFLCLYLVVEQILVGWCGPDRESNLFCLRAKDAQYFIRVLENALRSDYFHEFKSDSIRYTSCNVAALTKYGSLEFRGMKGTVDQRLIELWVDILLNLKKVALTLDNPTDISRLFEKHGPEGFLELAFPDPKHYAIFANTEDVSKKLWDGIRFVRDIAFACTWEAPLKDEPYIRKEKPKAVTEYVLAGSNGGPAMFVPSDEEQPPEPEGLYFTEDDYDDELPALED